MIALTIAGASHTVVTRDRSISSTTVGRVEHAMDDRRRARGDERRGREVERADVVQRPAREPEVGAGEAELDDVREVLPRQVGVGEHHALRAARGARRVHQPVDVVAGRRHARRDARRRPELGERRPPVGCRPARCRRGRASRSMSFDRFVREIDERLVAHERARFGVVEDVPQLRRREPPVDRHRDRAEVSSRRRSSRGTRCSCTRAARRRRRRRRRARAARRPARPHASPSRRR